MKTMSFPMNGESLKYLAYYADSPRPRLTGTILMPLLIKQNNILPDISHVNLFFQKTGASFSKKYWPKNDAIRHNKAFFRNVI